MNVVAGGAMPASDGGTETAVLGDACSGLTDNQQAIAAALLDCMRRWGLAKTTMGDIAREAGVSRATVYRLFPGGKSAILDVAAQAEARHLAEQLRVDLAAATTLEDCLVRAVHTASCLLAEHETLAFMRDKESVALEQVLSFEHLEGIFDAFAPMLQPTLERFLHPDAARRVAVWLARLVVSHLSAPSTALDLRDAAQAGQLVHDFVIPGIAPEDLSAVDLTTAVPITEVLTTDPR